ncbi:MAG: FecR domain-containing protein [Gammaproteobacteria bacterium]|nr:FecR domain-containing protein [Gammaproteobacteria bacterium]
MTEGTSWRHGADVGLDREALRQAGEWFVRLRDENVSDADRAAWQRWLETRPAHLQAWRQVEAVVKSFRRLGNEAERGAADATLDAVRGSRMGRRQALKQLSLLLGIGTLGWVAWRHTPLEDQARALTAEHRTGVGEIAGIALEDGTRVWLNTDTALNSDYGPRHRRLILVRGEILIETAVDPHQRPFLVDTAHGRLQALGTRFVVREHTTRTRVTVQDGAVAIQPQAGGRGVVRAGRETSFDARAVAAITAAAPVADAWARGQLVADPLPLGELVAELARYRRGRLAVAPEVAHMPVMGIYPLTDTDRALAMLADALPVRIRRVHPWWVIIESR